MPAFLGETPPTSFVPKASASLQWNVAVLPVKPWQMTVESGRRRRLGTDLSYRLRSFAALVDEKARLGTAVWCGARMGACTRVSEAVRRRGERVGE